VKPAAGGCPPYTSSKSSHSRNTLTASTPFGARTEPRDIAFCEERIRIHPALAKVCWGGTPDIGVLVFNKIPVMAFLRLPTKESAGRANMFQGAIACGIDIATGITTNAIKWTHPVKFFPGTRRKLSGIKIPEWGNVLKMAVDCQIALPKLGFMRADIVLQPSKLKQGKTFSKVLELNAQPGLKIQIANRAGLKRRLQRVEGLEVESAEKGIKIAKALFADSRLRAAAIGRKIAYVFEDIKIQSFMGEKIMVKAKLDTGAWRTSIDEQLAKKLGLLNPENILLEKYFKNALGKEKRPLISLVFWLKGRKIKTVVNIADRSKLRRPITIGRRDLRNFLIEPGK